MIVAMFLYCLETNKYIQILTFCFFHKWPTIVIYDIYIANPHRNSGIPTLIFQRRYTLVACGCSWGCCYPRLFLRSCAHNSAGVTVIPRNVCGRRNGLGTCCEPYGGGGGGGVPGAVKYCAKASVSRQWTSLSNPSDKQLRRLSSLSLEKLLLSLSHGKVGFEMIPILSHGFGEFNNNKKWRQSRCIVWTCCVIKHIHVNTGE